MHVQSTFLLIRPIVVFFFTFLVALTAKHYTILYFVVYTKTVDSVSRALWLATQSVNILHYSLIHL